MSTLLLLFFLLPKPEKIQVDFSVCLEKQTLLVDEKPVVLDNINVELKKSEKYKPYSLAYPNNLKQEISYKPSEILFFDYQGFEVLWLNKTNSNTTIVSGQIVSCIDNSPRFTREMRYYYILEQK
jgi:hypothetical protein